MRPHPWLARALVVALALVPLAGHGQPSPPPVTINSCQAMLDQNPGNAGSFLGIPIAAKSDGMAIEFVNESDRVASVVNFDVDSAGSRFVIRDVGSFAPGVSIKHTYRNGSGQGYVLPSIISPKVSCHVGSVKFADGSIWRPGQGLQSPPVGTPAGPGTLAALPTKLEFAPGTDVAVFLVQADQHIAGFKYTDM